MAERTARDPRRLLCLQIVGDVLFGCVTGTPDVAPTPWHTVHHTHHPTAYSPQHISPSTSSSGKLIEASTTLT